MTTDSAAALAILRQRIDELDRDILERLAERQHCVAAMPAHKGDADAVRAEPRRQEVLQTRKAWGEALGLDGEFVHELYRRLTEYFIALQMQVLPEAATKAKPRALIYSCSGCSDAAQLANHLALQMDREGLAEMSCIAGVGGDVKNLVQTATSGRPVVAVDGCPLHCTRRALARHGVSPALSYTLSELGVKKRYHQDFSSEDAERLSACLRADLIVRFPG